MIQAILIAIAVAVLHTTFFSALPWPLSTIDLPLIVILTLIGTFRFRDALLSALFAGTTIDLLSIMPFGTHVLVYLLVTLITIFLFTRVFTNHSWPGLLGMSAVAFSILHTLLLITRFTRAVFHGLSLDAALGNATALHIIIALTIQLAAVLTMMVVAAMARGLFSRFFFTR